MTPAGRPLVCEVRADALRENFRAVRKASTSARNILAVVKDDAYGHGLAQTAKALAEAAGGFALTEPRDAVTLRRAGIEGPIVLLNGMFSAGDADAVCESGAWVVAHEGRQVEWLSQLPVDAARKVFVKVDTGMGRLGFAPEEFASVRGAIENGGREVVLMTHFARADSADGLRAPMETIARLRGSEAKGLEVSLGNSAATMLHCLEDDWARVGIALYGASPAPAWKRRAALGLRAAMVLRTRLLSVRILRKGARVGYGGEFVAPEDMLTGVAAVGYGDGYPRLTREGWAMVSSGGGEGFRADVVGRVSMDLLALDLRGAPNAKEGDDVILWGDSPSADEVAAAGGMIAYELFSRLSSRTARMFLERGCARGWERS